MISKVKEIIANDKQMYTVAIVMLVVGFLIAYDVWSSGNVSTNGITTDTVRKQFESTGAQQQRAGTAIAESQRAVSEVRQTNTDIKREIDSSRTINNSSSELIADCKRILAEVRTSGKVKD